MEHRDMLHIRGITDQDVAGWPMVRTNQEELVMKLLTMLDVRFEYETSRLPLPDGRTYIPDFWLPELGTYLECKSGTAEMGQVHRADKVWQVAQGLRSLPGREELRIFVVRDTDVLHVAEDGFCYTTDIAPWCDFVRWARCGDCGRWQLVTPNLSDYESCRNLECGKDVLLGDMTPTYHHRRMIFEAKA